MKHGATQLLEKECSNACWFKPQLTQNKKLKYACVHGIMSLEFDIGIHILHHHNLHKALVQCLDGFKLVPYEI